MERVRLAVLFSVYVFHFTSGLCPQGRYGFQCAYSCNCLVAMCNSTDGCRSRTCNRGWSGPTCQKHNKALDQSASASSTHLSAGKAVDGNKTNKYLSCFHSAYSGNIMDAWWRVDLIETTLIHDVTIYFRTDNKRRRNGVQVYIAGTAASPTDGINCYNVTGNEDGSDIPDVLNVTCSGKGRYLVLYTTTKNSGDPVPILDFCEVQVHVCAPGTFGSDCDNYCHCARDVCNSVNGTCPSGVCLPGWQHDQCDTECTQGSYGQNCSHNCSDRNCKGDNSSCDHATGMCVGGCKAGWNGTDCTQRCIDSYGDGCAHQCSARNCSGTSTCDHVTGKCESGCNLGWKGGDCIKECIKGVEYGSDCASNCSARMCDGGTSACPQDTGRCESNCLSGWQGHDCTQECSLGTFGENCSEECGQCSDARDCHHVDGTCLTGCIDGWTNHTCTQKYSSMPEQVKGPESNAAEVFKLAGAAVAIIVVVAVVVIATVLVRRRRSQAAKKRDNRADISLEQIDVKNDLASTNDLDLDDDYVNPVYVSGAVADKNGPVPASLVDPNDYLAMVSTSALDSDDYLDPVCAKAVDSDEYLDPACASSPVEDDKDELAVDQDDKDTYYNIASAPEVTLVSVNQLQERIQELQVPVGGFQAEYEKLPTAFTRPYKDSQLPENKGKNRFTNYYPYDDTRVKLQKLPGKAGSDYINACYIDGYSEPKVYIAAQGPNRKTLTDFWRLIWEKNCTRIVMLTNLVEMGKTKCAAYWSDEKDLTVGGFSIAVIRSSERAHWVVRELQVTEKKTSTCRSFNHFHFTSWPDHWIPDETSLAEFLWLVRTAANTQDGPLFLHCSAGIGRTGTYIAVDYLLDQALAEDKVDVFGCVSKMRDQRKGMIQTKEQYSCVYLTLQEALEFGNTTMDVQEFSQNRSEKRTFKMGCREPSELIKILNTNRETSRNEAKFRGRLYIDGRSDIAAVEVESHLAMKGYLLTEAPSASTASLFWKLIDQQESATVIVLPDSRQNLSSYVPSPGGSLNLSPVIVKCSTENTINHDIVLRSVHVQINDRPPAPVHVYIANQLPVDSHSTLLELLEHVDLHTTGGDPQPVAVIYSDSDRKRGAMLCILSNIVQGLKYDKGVEIYNNMKDMVHCLDQDITQADVALCYDVASEFIESQSVYANA